MLHHGMSKNHSTILLLVQIILFNKEACLLLRMFKLFLYQANRTDHENPNMYSFTFVA